jgi:hypothetical protein
MNFSLRQCFVEIATWATIEQIYRAQQYSREAARAAGREYVEDDAGLEAALVKLITKHDRLSKRASHAGCRLCYPPSPVLRGTPQQGVSN